MPASWSPELPPEPVSSVRPACAPPEFGSSLRRTDVIRPGELAHDTSVRRRRHGSPGTLAAGSAAKLARMLEPLRRATATRYVAPLREGGSLPGLLEADDDGMYVTKFSGAGQGEGALVAEVLAGELARAIGLPVPELVVVDVAPELGHAEPDPEIQQLIAASPGPNLGMDFLPGSLPFTLPADPPIDPALAADIVWFDALVTNVDRTHRNP